LGGTNLPGLSFSAKTDYSTGASSGPHAITTGLINADGFTDIITANGFNNKLSILLGVGDGTFNPQTSLNTGTEPQGITTGDINVDSKLDIITANSFDGTGGNTASVFLGNGNNTFITKPVITTQSAPLSVILGDFNADTYLDIATANYGGNSVSILLGNGDGKFKTATNFETGSGSKSVAMGDVNGDGFLDLATSDFTATISHGLSLLLGNGDGSFKSPTHLTAGTQPFSVIMKDINGDGKIDLISANYGSNNVSILLGNGNGTFQSATSASTGTRPVSVKAADLDGDGKIDLAVANSYYNIASPINTISLLAGNGDGTFKSAVNFTTGTRPYSVTIADFNGDSKPDIATANEGSDNISVFLNTTNNPSNFTGQTYTIAPPATQTSITTSAAGAPSGLAFTTQPVITIKDAAGNTVTNSTAPVSMTISTGATTIGTATVNAINGIATFTNVGISGTDGTPYTLTFASSGLTSATQSITPVFSSNFTVTTTANSGSGSLREAITLANTTPGDDQISFNLTGASTYTITLASSLPTILNVSNAITGGTVGTLTINGLGATSLIISGLDNSSGIINTSRNFSVFNIATGGNLAISGVTVSGAKVTGNNGGGIYNGGTLTVFNSTISSNSTSYRGGGIYNGPSATLTVFNSTLSGNSANYSGGGIYNGQSAALTVNNSTLSGNSAGQGGGIRNSGGTLTISNSTFSGNSASNLGGGSGGGIFSGGTLTISNSTISGNSANLTGSGSARGGGIYTIGTGITFTISNSTISGNSATGHSKGGGIYNRGGTLIVSNSILYGNFAGYTGAEYFNFGTTTITGNNNISSFNSEIGTGCIIADPRLGPLQDNGGATFTMALLTGSPAINAGNATISNASPILGLDQRGFTRSSTAPSIGAYEFNAFGTATQATLTTNAAGAPSGLAFTTQPVITIKDASGNTATTSTAAVTMTVSTGATIIGSATINAINGIATFNNVGISGTSGTAYTLTFASTGLTGADQTITLADTTAPIITITSDKTALKSGETATLTFTLSEAASTALSSSNITVDGGTLSNFVGSGLTYTATFTPTNNRTTPATINVLANTFTDGAGNNNTAATELSINIDTAAPTITITSNKTALKSGQTATITFKLSETSADFIATDINTAGGALSNFSSSGLTYTATFTPSANSIATASINVLANTFTDAAANNNTASNTISITVDTLAPTITITSNKTSLRIGETSTLTFTLSEAVSTALVSSNITMVGGALSNFSGSGLTYTATFTPTNNSTTPATINVLANTFTDTAGNNNTPSNTISITVDTTAPTITISSNKTTLKSGETATITFTLSESSSTFSDFDIISVGGTLTTLSNSGLIYTATFTPTNNSTTPATINVLANTFTDTAGNNNTASNTISITVDTIAPTITITSDKTALKSGETATLTFTLSESSSTFIETDISITNGVLSNFAGSGVSYTATFTPTNNSTTLATINVNAGSFTDSAGNPNTASNTISITVDTTAPTTTIASDKTSLRIGETANITFTLSETSADFAFGDVTATGGALSNFVGSGTFYTATFTPNTNSTTAATINVASSTFTDAAGNPNTASTTISIIVDTTAPTITITSDKTALRLGETATLTFTLGESSSTFTTSDITVVGGTLSNFVGSGLTYTATFTPTNNRTTPATINVLANTFNDAAGNPSTASNTISITVDTTAPTITIASNKTTLRIGETATLTFTLSEGASDFIASDITVVGGTLGTLSGSGVSYTATFTPTNNTTTPATINVAAGSFTDAAGNNNTASNTISITVDTTAPTIIIASDKTSLRIGETTTLTFTLSEATFDFIASDIVTTGGTLGTLSGSGTSYTATFTPINNRTTPASINVLANTFTDAAGNNNTASNTISITVDTTSPTITISSNKTALKSGQTATITFTLSESSSTFSEADISITGGALSNFSGSGLTYTATFTPTNNSTTPASINVAASTFTDGVGNNNIASNTISITVDTTAPTITIASNKTTLRIGETATITFTLSEAASTALISSNITVVGGALSNFSGSGLTYTATFTPTINSTTTATFNVAAATFTDPAGNNNIAAAQFTIQVDTTAPSPAPSPTPSPTPTPTPTPTPSPTPAPSPAPTPTRMMTASSSSSIAGVSSTVNLIDQDTGKQISSVIPFPGFSGELRIAMADMNQDGKMETIIAAGPGGGPAIMVMDSETGMVLQTFFAFDPAFRGGIFVTVADVNLDGIMDIIVGAGSGGGPHIKFFDGLTQNVLRSFFAYQENFNGGVSVTATDINGDGFAELVTGTGSGGNSHVKVFDGKTFEIISQWYAYPSDFKGGIFVAVGDIGNDGKFEVVTGAGEGGGPVVAIWDPFTGALLNQFLAYDKNFEGGARVGISDGNGDGIADLLTGAGPGGGPQVNGYNFPALDLLFSFYSSNPSNNGGVFV